MQATAGGSDEAGRDHATAKDQIVRGPRQEGGGHSRQGTRHVLPRRPQGGGPSRMEAQEISGIDPAGPRRRRGGHREGALQSGSGHGFHAGKAAGDRGIVDQTTQGAQFPLGFLK